jgi:sugar phosphate isomerase/epimerase
MRANMPILVSDCARIDEILPIALSHHVGIEIQEFVSPDNIDENSHTASDIKTKLDRISPRGLHGPFSDLVPASRDQQIQAVTRNRFQRAYELAQAVGAQHLILHTGYIPKTYARQAWIENSVRFWVRFLFGKDDGLRIHLENVYEDDYLIIIELLDRVNAAVGRKALTVCLDVGHVHANSSRKLQEWIPGLGARIQYVHLHNNDGFLDNHWGLWKGKIDMVGVLDLLKIHAPEALWTVETIPADVEKSVVWLRDRGYL